MDASRGGSFSFLTPCISASRAKRSKVCCSSGVSLSSIETILFHAASPRKSGGLRHADIPINTIVINQRNPFTFAARRDHLRHKQSILTNRKRVHHTAIEKRHATFEEWCGNDKRLCRNTIKTIMDLRLPG